MKTDVALERYLERHIEPGLPSAPEGHGHWQNVLVIPVYNESAELLRTLSTLQCDDRALIILVLNRPDSNPDTRINSDFRRAIKQLTPTARQTCGETGILNLSSAIDLLCYDLEQLVGPCPANQGVGLARKVGCDIALLWQSEGAISSEWIFNTDADALLPPDYFSRLKSHPANQQNTTVAALYPFTHIRASSDDISRATGLYELRLHHYVLGLKYALSPYAYHTLGSCIAIKSQRYSQVRGYPKRSGGEDFYLLNKLAKLGDVISLSGECIALQSRASARVPFGTGPAIEKIISEGADNHNSLFYHPQCFEALRAFLAVAVKLHKHSLEELTHLLVEQGLAAEIANVSEKTLLTMGLGAAIEHCRSHGKSAEQFSRHFNQWFDGFRTLKFIHAVRDSGWPMQSLASVVNLQPQLFPGDTGLPTDPEAMRSALLQHWQWSVHDQNIKPTQLL